MKRFALLSVVAFALATPLVFAQTPPPPPAQKAKFIPPIKGTGTIDVIRTPAKRVGKELRTTIKVKNTSKGSINLLKIDQYWYDKTNKPVSLGVYRHKKAPILPGEIIEIVIVAEDKPAIVQDQMIITHAYGKLDPRVVKKFE